MLENKKLDKSDLRLLAQAVQAGLQIDGLPLTLCYQIEEFLESQGEPTSFNSGYQYPSIDDIKNGPEKYRHLKSRQLIRELKDKQDWQQALLEIALPVSLEDIAQNFPLDCTKERQTEVLDYWFYQRPFCAKKNGSLKQKLNGFTGVLNYFKKSSGINRLQIEFKDFIDNYQVSAVHKIGLHDKPLACAISEDLATYILAFHPEFPEDLPKVVSEEQPDKPEEGEHARPNFDMLDTKHQNIATHLMGQLNTFIPVETIDEEFFPGNATTDARRQALSCIRSVKTLVTNSEMRETEIKQSKSVFLKQV